MGSLETLYFNILRPFIKLQGELYFFLSNFYINISTVIFFFIVVVSILSVLLLCLNSIKIHEGDVISPWKVNSYHLHNFYNGNPFSIRNELEFVLGFIPFHVPYVKRCKNSCGKQTFRENGECIHCHYHLEFFNKPLPGLINRNLLILMMNRRNDNEFGRLPRDLVVYFIKNYL